MEHKKLYTVLEVAHLLSVGKNTVYQLITDGKLEVIDFNGFKVRDVTLEAFINTLSVLNRGETCISNAE